EQSDLDIGVEWFLRVWWDIGSPYLNTSAKDGVGPEPGVYDLKGKISSFPLSYDPCVALDPSKFAQRSGTVAKVEVEYIPIPELKLAAQEAGLRIDPFETKSRDISTCALKPGDPLPPGSTASTSDTDNDGIPNDSDPDVDGDGTPNTSDKDIDGDGIANKNDPDIDGDGIKNGIDKDSDGDGTPDAEDDTPGGPR
ncbi:MAG: hypothetical protein ACO39V_03805, partial [Arenicellales bacterium]